jgi:hypothetical protein
MAEALYPQANEPEFNILGLLLGGRPYAANYFSEVDKSRRDLVARQERGQFADQLLKSPEMRAANQNPYDRQGQWALWAAAQQGPDSAALMGANWLDKMVSATNEKANTELTDALAKQRIGLTADAEIRVAQAKQNMELAGRQKMVDALFGQSATTPGMTNAQAQLQRNLAYKSLLGDSALPSGYDVVSTPKGLGFTPTMGSPAWQTMMTDVQNVDDVTSMLNDLSSMARGDTDAGKGGWETTRQLLIGKYKDLMKTGTLDQGSLDFFDKMIPGRWDNVTNPAQGDIIQERLRVLQNRIAVSRKQLGDKYLIDPASLPDRAKNVVGASKTGDIPEPTAADFAKAKKPQMLRQKVDAARTKQNQAVIEQMKDASKERAKIPSSTMMTVPKPWGQQLFGN